MYSYFYIVVKVSCKIDLNSLVYMSQTWISEVRGRIFGSQTKHLFEENKGKSILFADSKESHLVRELTHTFQVSHGIRLYIHVSCKNPGFTSGQGIHLKFTSVMGIHSIPFTDRDLIPTHNLDVNQCPIHMGYGNQNSIDIGLGISTLELEYLMKADIVWEVWLKFSYDGPNSRKSGIHITNWIFSSY